MPKFIYICVPRVWMLLGGGYMFEHWFGGLGNRISQDSGRRISLFEALAVVVIVIAALYLLASHGAQGISGVLQDLQNSFPGLP